VPCAVPVAPASQSGRISDHPKVARCEAKAKRTPCRNAVPRGPLLARGGVDRPLCCSQRSRPAPGSLGLRRKPFEGVLVQGSSQAGQRERTLGSRDLLIALGGGPGLGVTVLNLRPEPHWHGSLRPVLRWDRSADGDRDTESTRLHGTPSLSPRPFPQQPGQTEATVGPSDELPQPSGTAILRRRPRCCTSGVLLLAQDPCRGRTPAKTC